MAKKGSALARQAKAFTPAVVQQLATLERDLGGRQELVGLLVLAPLNDDLRYMLGLLGDPTFGQKSLAEICATGNILPGALLTLLESAALLRGRVIAAQTIGKALPAVVQDVMERAAPYAAPCNAGCQGTGSITPDPTPEVPNPRPAPCEVCRGTGLLLYRPDIEHQKLALEMGEMLPKGGGILIQQNNGQGATAGSLGGGSLEQLQRLTDQILYGDAIEADIVPPEADPDPPPPN